MVSPLPARPIIVSPPALNLQALQGSMGHNYSVMGSGPLIPQYFAPDMTSGACPNPILTPKPTETTQYVQAPAYPRVYSPSNQLQQMAYLPPRTPSPIRQMSVTHHTHPTHPAGHDFVQAEHMRLTLPLSSRVTSGGVPNPVATPPGPQSPTSRRLNPEYLIGAKETWEAASAQCTLSEEVKLFLNDLGFSYYQEAFRRGGFEDMDTVLAMSQEDMRTLGMLPGHVLKMDMKLDELCKSQGKMRRGKPRLQIGNTHFPWGLPAAASPTGRTGISPSAAAAAMLGMSGMMPVTRSTVSAVTNPGAGSQQILAPSPKALQPKPQLALSPIGSRTPSPVDKDIHQFSTGWTDGRETGVTTVDEESDARSGYSEVDGEERTSSAPLEGSSEPNPSSGSPNSSATFTPHPMRALASFNSISTLQAGQVALPPRDQHTFGSTCTGLSVRTCPVGTPSGRFGAGARKMKREELEDLNARKQANKKVFAWLQANRFSNVNHERWFLGRGYYPLHAAVRENNVDMIKLLLSLKADPMKKNSGGQTPLEYAQAKQRTSIICDILQEYQLQRQF